MLAPIHHLGHEVSIAANFVFIRLNSRWMVRLLGVFDVRFIGSVLENGGLID